MERNPVARAMEWSVELERGLRSKTPLRRNQAISDFAPRLLQWSREPQPQPSPAAHQLFDLIPGEDRLFANAILLRLADAFVTGDHQTRVRVVEVFLAEHRERRRRGFGWLLSKERVSNCSELLRRVKSVFDDGDSESKSLALGLFGCWAGFSVESSHIRYLVLSSMVSSHVSEAKAALFAAGCFCEESDDFPCIVLEMLLNMMTSSDTLPPVRLATARLFAKMGKSNSTATKAYKTGLKLVMDSSDDDFQAALLISLSKIASRSSTLIYDQVHILFLLLSQEKTVRVRANALKCLHFIFSKRVCQFSVNADLVKALLTILDETELPTTMQCEALRILSKIILYFPPSLTRDGLDLDKLISIAENESTSLPTSLLAISVLADISKKCKGIRDTVSELSCPFPIPGQVVPLIMRRVTSLVKPLIDLTDSVKFREMNNLLNLLLSVVHESQDIAGLVLDQIVELVIDLGGVNGINFNDLTQTDTSVQDNVDVDGEKSKAITLKILCSIYRFLVMCLESLDEAGAITIPVFDKVKLLVKTVCGSKLLDSYTHIMYSLLLHSPVFWGHNGYKNEESCNLEGNSHILLHNYSVEHELIVLEFTKKILAENKNWMAYKVGICLASQGSWFSSRLIFQLLITQVRSDPCCRWLRSLFHLACAGRNTMLHLQTKQFSSLADMTEVTKLPAELLLNYLEEIGHDGTAIRYRSSKVILSAYKSICSAKETLEVDLTSGTPFCFQIWFLSLRAKVLRVVVDVLETLENIPFLWETDSTNWQLEKNSVVQSWLSLGQVSHRLIRLAKEFDLLRSSFIDMDPRSSKFISAMSLSISLLAFITGFSLFMPAEPETSTSGVENSKNSLCAHIVQNIAGRLWCIDHEISTKLCQLIDVSEDTDINCIHLHSRNQAFNVGSEARAILSICNFAVSKISCLRSKVETTHDADNAPRDIEDGLQLTLKLLFQWLQIPFRIPQYFFRFRPCIGSELFAVNVNKNPYAIRVLLGHHLPLSVCLQLRNMPLDLPFRPAKLFCVLYSSPLFVEQSQVQEASEHSSRSYKAWETDDMVEMNENLIRHVKNCVTKNIRNVKSSTRGSDECGFVTSFVCCEPNEKGQGLGSCLLDVSGFLMGSYRIKWQSCCIDNEGNYWNLLPLNVGPVFTIE